MKTIAVTNADMSAIQLLHLNSQALQIDRQWRWLNVIWQFNGKETSRDHIQAALGEGMIADKSKFQHKNGVRTLQFWPQISPRSNLVLGS